MAMYRKLGKTSSQRKALLRNQVTMLLASKDGKITTTEARAKEIQKIVEPLIALAVKEKDNFEEVKVMAKVARKDKDCKRVKEVVDGKILYTAQCTKCGEKIGGSGCYDLSEAEEKVVKWNKYGCPKCGKKYCFKVVEK